jgi:hypothetical protein
MAKSERGPRGPRNKNQETTMRTEVQSDSSGGGSVRIEPRIQREIGKRLRTIYDDVINEPVPSKFIELLEKLERSTTRKG